MRGNWDTYRDTKTKGHRDRHRDAHRDTDRQTLLTSRDTCPSKKDTYRELKKRQTQKV